MQGKFAISGAVLVFFAGWPAAAEPVPALDADALLSKATHIAVVVSVAEEREPADAETGSRAALRVARRIRGEDLPHSIEVWTGRSRCPLDDRPGLRKDDALLAFLVRSPTGSGWELADPYYGLIRVTSAGPAGGGAGDAREAVLRELRASLEAADSSIVRTALGALTAFKDREALPRAVVLSQDKDAVTAARALRFRFALGDESGLEEALKLAEETSKLGTGERDALAWSLVQPELKLPMDRLNRLLAEAKYATLRRVAAVILSERGDESSLAVLVGGLADADRETQYRCVVGLCRITGQSGPGYEAFAKDPQPVIEQWKAWWAAR